jgi:hypothetical protein
MKVAVIMGSINDLEVMKEALEVLEALGIPYEARVVSAHRTPDFMAEFAKRAEEEGFEVVIAGAGGAAHLPGMTASHTPLPVIGVPIPARHRLAPLHSPDAEGHPRRHRGHRRRYQRRLPGRQDTRRQVPRGEGKSEETHGADERRRPLEKLHKVF